MQKILKNKNTPPLWGTPLQEGNQGFTLIEALVGLAIVLIAVIGPLSVSMNGIKTITQNKNRLIATYLAEEMTEELRNYRDGFFLICKDLDLEYALDGNGDEVISAADCKTISVPSNLLNSSANSQSISWRLFLDKVNISVNDLDLNSIATFDGSSVSGGLDKSSFDFNNLNTAITIKYFCNILYLSQNDYSCNSSGVPTNFSRSITLTKISTTAIKVEVKVVYAKSGLFNNAEKAINLIDYIYMR